MALVQRIISSLELHARGLETITDRIRHAGNIHSMDPCFGMHNSETQAWITCVPCIVAGGPRQIPSEGEPKVIYSPGQYDDVIEI